MNERRPINSGRMASRAKCLQCAARATALCGGIGEEAADALGRITHRMRVPEGRVIFGESGPAKNFAIIISGVVKMLNTRPDGRHQIVGLQFPSEFVGRPYAEHSNLIAEAATDLELCCFSGRVFEDLLLAHHDLESALLQQVLRDLDGAREWMFLLGRKSAQERISHFLLMIAERMQRAAKDKGSAGQSRTQRLPLSRSEIADCLGLRIETVSRQLTQLKSDGVIATGRKRSFEILDFDRLRQCSEPAAE